MAINGGATFSNVPEGTYVDIVTGKSYQGGGNITVSAPKTKGQLRVLVKDWTGGKVGEDGKFIYDTTPVAHGGNPTFADVPTKEFYTADDVVANPSVRISPDGGEFYDDEIAVTIKAVSCSSAWYRIGDSERVEVDGSTATFRLGNDLSVGDSVTVYYGAIADSESTSLSGASAETLSGHATFRKVVKPEGLTIYYDNSLTAWSPVKIHFWSIDETTWPGVDMTFVKDDTYKYIVPIGTTGVVFNNGKGAQTVDVTSLKDNHLYRGETTSGKASVTDTGIYTGNSDVSITINDYEADSQPVYYNLQGIRVNNPAHGCYIVRRGSKVEKVYIN